jgi:AGZA family xanthine/uracil permease-like MFS transporter
LLAKNVKGALFIGIICSTAVGFILEKGLHIGAFNAESNLGGWSLNVPSFTKFIDVPDFSLLANFSLLGAFRDSGIVVSIIFVFSLFLIDFFDSMGTMFAIGNQAGLLGADGNPYNSKRILIVDAFGAIAGGAGSVSTNTGYIESSAGVSDGAKTGFAPVITGICFFLSMFFAPVVRLVPFEATAPALVIAGFLMMSNGIKHIEWDKIEIALPAFITIVLMPFSYSIADGFGAGFIFYTLLTLVKKKKSKVNIFIWIITILYVIYFAITPISKLLGFNF